MSPTAESVTHGIVTVKLVEYFLTSNRLPHAYFGHDIAQFYHSFNKVESGLSPLVGQFAL